MHFEKQNDFIFIHGCCKFGSLLSLVLLFRLMWIVLSELLWILFLGIFLYSFYFLSWVHIIFSHTLLLFFLVRLCNFSYVCFILFWKDCPGLGAGGDPRMKRGNHTMFHVLFDFFISYLLTYSILWFSCMSNQSIVIQIS